jgi:SAM-dependent methyltransferase
MKQQTRSRIATGLDQAKLLRPAERVREGWLSMQARGGPAVGRDGLPLPAARLRLLVDGRSGDAKRFQWVGAQGADLVRAAVAESGASIESLEAILDFGCGCGRVARHWASLERTEVHGCDYNPELVEWCGENLPFLRATVNRLEPPLPYVGGSFDLVYAMSVLSHLSEPLQQAWIAEFHRILRPGGLLLVSVLGDACADRLTEEQRRRYDRGELVVERTGMSGSNLCTAYHPRTYVRERLLADFANVRVVEDHSREPALLQDPYVARRPLRGARLRPRRSACGGHRD